MKTVLKLLFLGSLFAVSDGFWYCRGLNLGRQQEQTFLLERSKSLADFSCNIKDDLMCPVMSTEYELLSNPNDMWWSFEGNPAPKFFGQ